MSHFVRFCTYTCHIVCDSRYFADSRQTKAIDDIASSIAFHIFPHIRTLSSPFRPGRSLRSGLQFWPRFTFRLRRHETISHFQRRRQVRMLPYCALAGNRISQGENRNARKLVLIDCESAQRRRRQLGNRLVVDADDADVAGHNHTNRVERLQHADRDDVRRNNNCVRQCAVVVTDKLLPSLRPFSTVNKPSEYTSPRRSRP